VIYLVIFVILLALAFDYSNGFHDAANSIATVVATRVLRPMQAVAWAAFFNFIAAFTMDTKVATTIAADIVDPHAVDVYVVLATLVGAIAWNVLTWFFGLPTSSSHALIGGLIGASVSHSGWDVVIFQGKLSQTILFIALAPMIGMALGAALMVAATWLT
jgi:PiT family inorganic phosphate transporter